MSQEPDNQAPPAPAPATNRHRRWLLVLALVAVVAMVVTMPVGPQHSAVRAKLVSALEQQTGRQVRIGRVWGSLWQGLVIEQVSLSDAGGFGADGRNIQLTCDRIRIRYHLLTMARTRDPLRGISSIVLEHPQAKLTWRADGTVDLVELFRRPKPVPDQVTTFTGRVRLSRGMIVLVDERHPKAGQPRRHDLREADLDVRFLSRGHARIALESKVPGTVERVALGGDLVLDGGWRFDGHGALEHASLEQFAPYLNGPLAPNVELRSGLLSVKGTFRLNQPRDPKLPFDSGYDLELAAEGCSLRSTPFRDAGIGMTGRARYRQQSTANHTFNPDDGVWFDNLRFTMVGARATLNGRLVGISDLALDLRIAVEQLSMRRLAAALKEPGWLTQVTGDGLLSGDLRWSGRAGTWRLAGSASPRGVGWAGAGQVDGGRLDLDLKQDKAASDGWAGRVDLVAVDAVTPRLAAPLTGWRGRVVLDHGTVALERLSGRLGGASLEIDGRLLGVGGGRRPDLDLRLATTGLSPLVLRPLLPAQWQPREASGGLTGEIKLRGAVGALSVAGRLTLPALSVAQGRLLGGRAAFDLRLGTSIVGWADLTDVGLSTPRVGVPLTGVTGRLELAGGEIVAHGLRGRLGGDALLVDGRVRQDFSHFALSVEAPDFDLGRSLVVAGGAGLAARGRASAHLRLDGSPQRFRLAGRAALPYLRGNGWQWGQGRVALDVEVQPRLGVEGLRGWLRVDEARLRVRGVDGLLTVDHADLYPDGDRLRIAKLTGAVNGDRLAASGLVVGLRPVRSLDVMVTSAALGQSGWSAFSQGHALHLDQPAAVDLHVHGPWPTPTIDGTIVTAGATWDGEQPVTLAGSVDVALTLAPAGQPRPPLPVTGQVRLREAAVTSDQLGAPLSGLNGWLRLARDGSITIVRERDSLVPGELAGRLGDSPLRVAGTVWSRGKSPWEVDLVVDTPSLAVADVKSALSRLKDPPQLAGEGTFAMTGLRISGPLDRLRIVSAAGDAGWVTLPQRLAYQDWQIGGGRARADLTITKDGPHHRTDGTLIVEGSRISGGSLRAEATVTGSLRLADGRLAEADVDAAVGGGTVKVASRATGDHGYGTTVSARGVTLADLLPDQRDALAALSGGVVDSDLTVEGPPENLAITGRLSLDTGGGGAPAQATVSLRLARGQADKSPAQLLGVARLAGGDLGLSSLDEPLRDVRGEVRFTRDRLVFDHVTALLAQAPVRLEGRITDLPRGLFDLVVDTDPIDLGAVASAVRVAPAADEAGTVGPHVSLWQRWGLPALATPQPGRARLTLRGPREHVVAAIEADVPRLALPRSAVVPTPRGLETSEAGSPTVTLATNLRLRGQALGSLGTDPLPTGDRVAALLEQLAGLAPARQVRAESPPDDTATKEPLSHRFTLDLRATGDGLRARQMLALTTKKSRDDALNGWLGQAYTFAPGNLTVSIAGRADQPELEADLSCPRWELRGMPVRGITAHLRVAGGAAERLLTFTNLAAQIRGGTLTGSGAVRLRPDQPVAMEARFRGEGLEVAALGALGLTKSQPDGIASADVVVQLTEGRKLASGTVRAQRLRLGGQRVGDGEAQFELADRTMTLQRLLLRDPETNAFCRLHGTLGFDDDSPLALSGDVRGFELDRLTPLLGNEQKLSGRLSGRLDFAGDITGTRQFPLVGGVANVFFGSLAGVPFTRLSLRSAPHGPREVALNAELNDSAYTARLDGTISDLDSRAGTARYALEGTLNSRDLGQLAPLAAPKVPALAESEGTVVGQVSLTGRVVRRTEGEDAGRLNALADLRGTASLHLGSAARSPLKIAGVELDAADLDLVADHDQVHINRLEFATGSTRVALKPGTDNAVRDLDTEARVELHLVTQRLRYDDLVGLTRVPLHTEGYVDGEAEVTGLVRKPAARVTFATHGLRIEGDQVPDQVIGLRLARGEIRLDRRTTLDLFGAKVEVEGGWVDGRPEGEVRLTLHNLTRLRQVAETVAGASQDRQPRLWQSQLRGYLDSLPAFAAGRLSMVATLRSAGDETNGLVRVNAVGLQAVGADGPRPLPPMDAELQLGLGLSGGPKAIDARSEPGIVYLTGSARLVALRLADVRLRLSADDVDLRPYGAWSPSLKGLAGSCSVAADITAPAKRLVISNGRLAAAGLALGQVRLATVHAERVALRDGVLSFQPLEIHERSLAASLSGKVPLERTAKGIRLRDDPARPVDLRGGIDVFDLSDFEDQMGSVGWIEGNAKLELVAQGRASEARVAGAATLQMPLLQVVDRPGKEAPVTAGGTRTMNRRGEVVLLQDTQVRLTIDQNLVRLDQCEGAVVPADYAMTPMPTADRLAKDRADGRIGSFTVREAVLPGRDHSEPALELRHFERARLLENPINLDLDLAHVTARSKWVAVRDLSIAGQIRARQEDNRFVANEARLVNCSGWVNDGWASLTGTMLARAGDLRRWAEQEYHLRLTTPSVDPKAPADSADAKLIASAPKAATPRPTVDGRIVYPVAINDPAAGLVRVTADVGLDSHTREYGPLTLWGKLLLTDVIVREGALALLSSDPNRPRRDWPAAPELKLSITAPDRQRNRILTRVPAIDLPFATSLTLSETPQRLRLDGTVDVASGSVYASVLKAPIEVQSGNATLRVQRNPQTGAFEPHAEFDSRSETVLRAARRGSSSGFGGEDNIDYHVSLRVRGTVRPGVEKPETEFRVDARSTPPLPEETIFARLSTSNDFAQALERGTLESFVKEELANAALQTAITYTFTPVFEEIRKGIGLDEFAVQYELNQPFEVRLGKYLVRNLFAGVKVSVNERGDSRQVYRVSYQISNAFKIGGQVDTRDDYRFTVEYQAGF